MDSFSVSVSKGLASKDFEAGNALKIATFFGLFQAIMPAVGWSAGVSIVDFISGFDHWAAFLLLCFVGCKMICESTRGESQKLMGSVKIGILLMLSVATSIDALAVGLSLSFLKVPILTPALTAGIVTFLLSFGGVYLGTKFGRFLGRKVEVAGGLILIGIGAKILVEHLV